MRRRATRFKTIFRSNFRFRVKDYFELRDLIAEKPETFARGFTEAPFEYALGRPYGFTDRALADDIAAKAKLRNFALIVFIAALAISREFGRKCPSGRRTL